MSLILEALRKSEAERQIGRAPGLLTPMSMTAVQPPRGRWWRVSLLVTLVVIAIALAWWWGRNGQSRANDTNPPGVASADAPAPNQASNPTLAVAAAANDEQAAPASAATIATPPPVTRPLPSAGPADFPSDPDFQSTERESLPLPAPVSAPPPITAAPAPAAPRTAAPVIDAAPTAAPTRMTPSETDLATTAPTTTVLLEVPAATPLSALSQTERAGLPPLRLSMHVFNAEPSRRFVMIDGHRRIEGDTLAEQITLTEIRREGALVDIRGRRVLIERP